MFARSIAASASAVKWWGLAKIKCSAPAELENALAYIASHPEIWEVILTGGDPFMLSPRRIADVTARLSAIPHVKVLRWHTRMPVADPHRISGELVHALRSNTPVYVAIHVNHPRELTAAVRAASARLADAGIPLLSQTVLLKGVNDDAETLEALMRALIETRIKPYYLHHPDLAPGTAQFRVSIGARPGAPAPTARARLGPLSAALRARHSRRLFQGAARTFRDRREWR